MKKLIKKVKTNKKTLVALAVLGATLTTATIGFALPGGGADTTMLDNLFAWLCKWVGRIGMIVAFFGAIQTCLGFYRNDPDGKVSGLKTLASGFMVYGISISPDLFGF
jgi:hypothetical protein